MGTAPAGGAATLPSRGTGESASREGCSPGGLSVRRSRRTAVVGDDLVTVESYLHRDEADIARAHLASAGIEAMVVADDEGGLSPGFFAEFRVRLVTTATNRTAAWDVLGVAGGVLPTQVMEAIVAHATWCAPEEACGLLAMDGDHNVRMAYATTNTDRSPYRFTVDPGEHMGALLHAERNGWHIGGSFHSHPAAPPVPSERDIAGALDPDWLYVIAGPAPDPVLRTYRIVGGEYAALMRRPDAEA